MKKLLVLLFLSSYLLACSKTVESNIESNQAIDFATQTLNMNKQEALNETSQKVGVLELQAVSFILLGKVAIRPCSIFDISKP